MAVTSKQPNLVEAKICEIQLAIALLLKPRIQSWAVTEFMKVGVTMVNKSINKPVSGFIQNRATQTRRTRFPVACRSKIELQTPST